MAFFDSTSPLVFAHRGGAALAPENTLPAFARGLAAGADGLELDVRLSADGVPVVHHDPTLERTTDGHGALSQRTAAELARVDAGYHFGPERGHPYRGQGIGVPTLRSVLANHRDTQIIIELKDDVHALGDAAAEVVREADAVERVCFGGFPLRALMAVRARLPQATTSAHAREVRWALYRSWCRLPVRRPRYRGYQVPEVSGRTRIVSPTFVRLAHVAGLPVQVWTVDDEADMRRLLAWGVDALITNRPDRARRVVDDVVAGGHGNPAAPD